MSTRNLWYVRQGEKISGPYPPQLIVRNVRLGRFRYIDRVSVDQVEWVALGDVPDLLPKSPAAAGREKNPVKRAWREERMRASLRWIDERHLPDRRAGKKASAAHLAERRAKKDRRMEERQEVHALRQRHAENQVLLKKRRERFYTTIAVLAGLAVGALIVINLAPAVNAVKVGLLPSGVDCRQPPRAQINWAGCNKNGVNLAGADLRNANLVAAKMQGARLRGADLGYASLARADLTLADLAGANLVGANLTGAALASANLAGADLRFADLRGADLASADLTGAQLGNTVWPDGRVCDPVSVGKCR